VQASEAPQEQVRHAKKATSNATRALERALHQVRSVTQRAEVADGARPLRFASMSASCSSIQSPG
jgi:hypothetical protein